MLNRELIEDVLRRCESCRTGDIYGCLAVNSRSYAAKTEDYSRSVANSHNKIERILRRKRARLADGRTYLVGDKFSAADPDLCKSSRSYCTADWYGVKLPQLDELPDEMAATIKEFRKPSWRYALCLFREERRSLAQLSQI